MLSYTLAELSVNVKWVNTTTGPGKRRAEKTNSQSSKSTRKKELIEFRLYCAFLFSCRDDDVTENVSSAHVAWLFMA